MSGRAADGAVPWRHVAGSVLVRFRLTPKSSRDAIEGLETTADGPAFKARVRAVPEDGAANAALEKLVAIWLGVPQSAVHLVAGVKSRVKTVGVEGDPAAIAERLHARFDALDG